MLHKFFVAAISVLSFSLTHAQVASVVYTSPVDSAVKAPADESRKDPVLTISGSIDAYYRNDLADVKTNSYTSFTPMHNSFSLGMASLKFTHKSDKVEAVADLGFGPRAKDFAYTDAGITQAIKQLYISYTATDWLKLTLGTWSTHVGYELLDPQLNRNYSMSYMFTNGPFSHTGLKADISAGKHAFMLGVSNATDYRIPPDGMINKKFVLAQYSFAASDNFKIYLNYVGGQNPDTSKTNQFDAVITAKLGDKFNIGYNGTLNSTQLWDGSKNMESKSWWGSALYFNYDPHPWLGLTLRSELFSDKHQFKTLSMASEGCNILATTLSASFKAGGFTFIPELRVDKTNKAVLFVDKGGSFTKSATSIIFAAVYAF